MIKTGRNGNIKRKIDVTSAAAWKASTEYKIGGIVTNESKTYICIKEHTSASDFAADFAADNWEDITDGVAVTKMGSWKLNIKQSLIETSHFGDGGWESSTPGTKNWSGTMEGSFNGTDDKYGQLALQKAVDTGEEIELDLFVDENKIDEKYNGKVYIEEVDIDTQTKNLVKISIKFKGNGKLNMPQ